MEILQKKCAKLYYKFIEIVTFKYSISPDSATFKHDIPTYWVEISYG
jgi:hypothetical protein